MRHLPKLPKQPRLTPASRHDLSMSLITAFTLLVCLTLHDSTPALAVGVLIAVCLLIVGIVWLVEDRIGGAK